MQVRIRDRSHNNVVLPDNIALEPVSQGWEALGGPAIAQVRATGRPEVLWQLLEWLRYDVQILDIRLAPVWWGYVQGVYVYAGPVSFGVALDNMANTIAAIWSSDTDGGVTGWAIDTDSAVYYGTKELLLSVDGVNAAAAEQRRDWELAQRKYPHGIFDVGQGSVTEVILELWGWQRTLDWVYYGRDEGLVEYAGAGGAPQKLGWGNAAAHMGFSARRDEIGEYWARFNTAEKGEKFRLTGTTSNNTTFTVESSSTRERTTYTAATIAFMKAALRSNNEYLRASHNVPRQLNYPNLWQQISNLSTLSAAAAGGAMTIKMVSVSEIANGDRIRIELDAGGYHETFAKGRADDATGDVEIETAMPSLASIGNDVDRVNRWVANDGETVVYTEGVSADYTIDATNGTITVRSAGAIAANQVIRVNYIYDAYRIEDSALGLGFINAGDFIEVSGSASNNNQYEVIGSGTEGDYANLRHAVVDEAPGATVTIVRGSNVAVEEAVTDERNDSSVVLTGYGQYVAQSFQIPSDEGWIVDKVEVKLRKVGSPGSGVRAAICSNSAGVPGSSLETVTVAAASISHEADWVTFQFANTTGLSVATTYWIRLEMGVTAELDTGNYYEVMVDEDKLYTAGALKVYDGTAYQDRPTDADMLFRVLGREETTAQIAEIVEQEGQFFVGSDIRNTSSVYINQYRPGRSTGWQEVLALLELGTANDRRLLAEVTMDRYLAVREEEAEPAMPDYWLLADGSIVDRIGERLAAGDMRFVGRWMGLKDVLPPTAAISYIAKPTPFFCEAADYDFATERYRIRPRGAPDVWTFGEVGQG